MQDAKSLSESKVGSMIVTDGLGNDIVKGAVTATGAFLVAAVGIWAISCLVSGAIAAGGPLALLKSWFVAVGL